MPAVITRGIPEQFLLKTLDPEGGTYVVIKPATVAENAQRDELWSNQTRTYNANTPAAVEVRSETTFAQRQALEVYLTMIDCNIMWQDVDDEGNVVGEPKPIFQIGRKPSGEPFISMQRVDFLAAWGKLPQTIADEIYAKVLEKNPQWDLFRS